VIRRVIGLLLVVVTGCALVSVARNVPAEASRQRGTPSLPVTPAAEVPVCPGPETLQIPEGATPVPAPGPVTVAAVVASPSALGQAVEAGDPSSRTAQGPPAPAGAPAPMAVLGPVTEGVEQFAAATPSAGPAVSAGSSASASPAPGPSASASGSAKGATGGPAGAPGESGPTVRVVQARPTQAGAWRLDAGHVREVPVAAAAQWTLGASGDLRGLVTTTCQPATTDIWLVGGGTRPGHRARLLLANPGVAPAVVDVTVLGPQGVVQAPAGNGVTVAPGRQKALYLDAIAPGLSAMALHVQARTGRVAATLHDSVVRGVTPGGADDVPAAAEPARHLVIPGLAIAAPAPFAGKPAGSLPIDPTAAGAVAVRVADPGGTEAVVRVHLVGPDGDVNLPGGGVATVPPRGVADVVVTGVPDGLYSAVVEADSPVVAAALVGRSRAGSEAAGTPAAARGGVPGAELAWAAAGRPLQATTAIALPQPSAASSGPRTPTVTARLALTALGGAGRVALAEVAADGAVGIPHSVEVPADRAVAVELTRGIAGVLLRADASAGPLVGAVVLTGSDASGELISVQSVRPGSQIAADAPAVVQDPRVGLRSSSR
jgi:hypothetical protein